MENEKDTDSLFLSKRSYRKSSYSRCRSRRFRHIRDKTGVPYTSADLNWMDKKSRSTVEMNDPACRPEIASRVDDMDSYDTIFLGFPIWWYREPSIIDTFLESYDFTGKKIILFATSGGSSFGKTAQGLKKLAPGADIVEGRLLNGRPGSAALKEWISEII